MMMGGMELPTEDTLRIKEYVLEKMAMYAGTRISREVLVQSRIEVMDDFLTGTLAIKLAAYIMAEELEAVTETYGGQTATKLGFYPASWWDAFKHKHFHGWLRKRFPTHWKKVKVTARTPTRQITLRRLATYPQANIAWPALGAATIKFQAVDREHYG